MLRNGSPLLRAASFAPRAALAGLLGLSACAHAPTLQDEIGLLTQAYPGASPDALAFLAQSQFQGGFSDDDFRRATLSHCHNEADLQMIAERMVGGDIRGVISLVMLHEHIPTFCRSENGGATAADFVERLDAIDHVDKRDAMLQDEWEYYCRSLEDLALMVEQASPEQGAHMMLEIKENPWICEE